MLNIPMSGSRPLHFSGRSSPSCCNDSPPGAIATAAGYWCCGSSPSFVVSAIGSSVGSTFSQGFALKGTESQQAADLLEARFPARAGDEGQIVFAR